MGRHPDTTYLLKLYRWLVELADMELPCPTNQEIADRYGFSAPSRGSQHMRMLVELGLIRIKQYPSSRLVTICRTGQQMPRANRQPKAPWSVRKLSGTSRAPDPDRPSRGYVKSADRRLSPMKQKRRRSAKPRSSGSEHDRIRAGQLAWIKAYEAERLRVLGLSGIMVPRNQSYGAARKCQYIKGGLGSDICGKDSQPGSSYCPAHHDLCHEPLHAYKHRIKRAVELG